MKRKRRYRAADWIALGHRALAERGYEAIKLEAICEAAGLTRGSFYYHFTDHTSFLSELAKAWAKQATEDLVEALDGRADADARKLNDMALSIDYALEVGIRELARRVPEVAGIVAETDTRRLAVLSDLARARFGLEEPQAADLAFIEYASFCGMMLIRPGLERETRLRLSGILDAMMRRFARTEQADAAEDRAADFEA